MRRPRRPERTAGYGATVAARGSVQWFEQDGDGPDLRPARPPHRDIERLSGSR